MNDSISLKFAWRNLSRNFRRTLLSVVGVAIGCSIALIDVSLVKGKIELFIRSVAESGVGHLRLEPEGWIASRDSRLRLKEWEQNLALLRKDPRVRVATPRLRAQALMAMGTRLSGTEVVGVDPLTEPQSFRIVRTLSEGRYLQPGDKNSIVIGGAIADNLRVGIDDAIVLTVVANDNSLHNEMFNIIGIVRTGNKAIDQTICQINRPELETMTGAPGALEIAILLKDPEIIPKFKSEITAILPGGNILFTWSEISPQTQAAVGLNQGMANLITALLISVALLGVASAQLTAILERKKEFAVLLAVGMKGSQIVRLVLIEAIVLGIMGAVLTILFAAPLTYYFYSHGIQFTRQGDGGLTIAGALIEPVIRGGFGAWVFTDALVLSLTATLLASIYPAWFAQRLDPAEALRVAQ